MILAATFAIGCVKNVPQHSHSGKDYRRKGAKKIKLDEDGEGRAKGIVTYPGGDRVDWKQFETPEGMGDGELKIKLRWKPPRRGLDLAFNVYDQYFHRVARAKPSKKRRRSKSVTIDHAVPGKYYIQIYAPRRIDAGAYRVSVQYEELPATVEVKMDPSQIPDPPKLAGVPEPVEEDPKVEDPKVEDPKVEDPKVEDPPADRPKPYKTRVVGIQLAGRFVIVTLKGGTNRGISRDWTGSLLRGGSSNALTGGELEIIKVTKSKTVARVKLTIDQVSANKSALLSPP